MTQAALPLEERVARLEHEMAEVRFMAGRTDREVSDLQAVLNGHTGVLNAIRDDQRDQGRQFAKFEAETRREFADVRAEMRDGFAKVDANFAKVDANFAKVEEKFALLSKGQEAITRLLTKHLGDPDDETPAGGAGE